MINMEKDSIFANAIIEKLHQQQEVGVKSFADGKELYHPPSFSREPSAVRPRDEDPAVSEVEDFIGIVQDAPGAVEGALPSVKPPEFVTSGPSSPTTCGMSVITGPGDEPTLETRDSSDKAQFSKLSFEEKRAARPSISQRPPSGKSQPMPQLPRPRQTASGVTKKMALVEPAVHLPPRGARPHRSPKTVDYLAEPELCGPPRKLTRTGDSTVSFQDPLGSSASRMEDDDSHFRACDDEDSILVPIKTSPRKLVALPSINILGSTKTVNKIEKKKAPVITTNTKVQNSGAILSSGSTVDIADHGAIEDRRAGVVDDERQEQSHNRALDLNLRGKALGAAECPAPDITRSTRSKESMSSDCDDDHIVIPQLCAKKTKANIETNDSTTSKTATPVVEHKEESEESIEKELSFQEDEPMKMAGNDSPALSPRNMMPAVDKSTSVVSPKNCASNRKKEGTIFKFDSVVDSEEEIEPRKIASTSKRKKVKPRTFLSRLLPRGGKPRNSKTSKPRSKKTRQRRGSFRSSNASCASSVQSERSVHGNHSRSTDHLEFHDEQVGFFQENELRNRMKLPTEMAQLPPPPPPPLPPSQVRSFRNRTEPITIHPPTENIPECTSPTGQSGNNALVTELIEKTNALQIMAKKQSLNSPVKCKSKEQRKARKGKHGSGNGFSRLFSSRRSSNERENAPNWTELLQQQVALAALMKDIAAAESMIEQQHDSAMPQKSRKGRSSPRSFTNVASSPKSQLSERQGKASTRDTEEIFNFGAPEESSASLKSAEEVDTSSADDAAEKKTLKEKKMKTPFQRLFTIHAEKDREISDDVNSSEEPFPSVTATSAVSYESSAENQKGAGLSSTKESRPRSNPGRIVSPAVHSPRSISKEEDLFCSVDDIIGNVAPDGNNTCKAVDIEDVRCNTAENEILAELYTFGVSASNTIQDVLVACSDDPIQWWESVGKKKPRLSTKNSNNRQPLHSREPSIILSRHSSGRTRSSLLKKRSSLSGTRNRNLPVKNESSTTSSESRSDEDEDDLTDCEPDTFDAEEVANILSRHNESAALNDGGTSRTFLI